MFWADRLAQEIEKTRGKGPLVIRDEKTMSGYAHIGSMLSASMHGLISETLLDQGVKNIYYFEFNDMDAFDGIPVYLEGKGLEPHLGKSLKDVPFPGGAGENYAQHFAQDFKEVITGTGFTPQFDFSSEWYLSGKMDDVIREALLGAKDIHRIYKEVSGGVRKGEWLPILMKCPTCKKMSTTNATDFDGNTVQVDCHTDKPDYTKGCGFSGRISPFCGNGKLPWKVEWAAKWKVRKVEIEGAGKDHSTKGGAHNVADHICREVFHYETPFFVPHEFFLVGGKKISSSKGLGSTARAIFELLPPKMFRLALLGKDINQQRNFDPEGDSIPILYDQYDKLAENYWSGNKDDYARLFEFIHKPAAAVASQKSSDLLSAGKTDPQARLFARQLPPQQVLPRFSQVAFVVQMPHMDLHKEFPDADRAELNERAEYAKRWLSLYAPEKYVFKLQDTLPDSVKNLTTEQKNSLHALKDFIAQSPQMPSGEELHTKLHELKEFKAVYLAFLGKDHGPKAGWFLSALPKEFVEKRLEEACK